MLENFHFLRPLLLLGLLPALLFVLLLLFVQNNRSAWNRAIDPDLLPFLLDRSASPRRNLPLYGLLLIWVLSILALAGPAWQQIPVPLQEREDALVIVADLSMSMYANDLPPNRAVRVQRKIIDVLNTRRREGQTALVVYAGDAHAVTPLTDDVETIGNLVPSLQPNIMPILGSKPDAGIQLALELLENSGLPQAQILLMTDGIASGDIPLVQNLLADSQHSLAVLGIGTEEGAPIPMPEGGFLRDAQNAIVIPRLERDKLQQLAAAVGGRYADALLTDEDIAYLLGQSIFEETENMVEAEREFDIWHETGPWLLLLAAPLAALTFRRGWLLSLCLLLIAFPDRPAYAWQWTDLWMRKDQQASAEFGEENYAEAAALFQDQAWRSAANYRSENYEQAATDLALLDDPESHYNRGNALAKAHQFPQAIEAYNQTLALMPDHEDALHNKELVERIMEQQEQQPGDQGQDQNQEQDGDQQNSPQDQDNQNSQDQQDQEAGQDNQEDQQADQEDQQQADQNDESEEPRQQENPQTAESEQGDSEQEQAMQQWLRRIPDDPGELLRRKFQYQAQQRLLEQLQNPALAEREGDEQTW